MARSFPGGVHPPESKEATRAAAIQSVAVSDTLVVSLRQSMGGAAAPTVEKGRAVAKGEPIGRPSGFISAAVHAPTSGTVSRLGRMTDPATGGEVEAVEIEADGEDRWHEQCNQERDWRSMPPEEIRDAVRDAGLVGLGGANFPTHVKLSPPGKTTIEQVVINGAECEPFLTCDHRLMLAEPEKIVEGLEVFMRATGAAKGIVALEENKADAAQVLRDAAADVDGVEVVTLPVKYPQGAEKQLIKSLTGREVPSGGLPADVGVVVQNAGTARAACEALRWRRPLIDRVVTITGDAVERPANYTVRIGTSVAALLEASGLAEEVGKVIMGGPMMGVALASTDTYVVKGMSGLLCLRDPVTYRHRPCIRCGRCVDACPARLLPSTLSLLGEAYEGGRLESLDEALELSLMDCIECGACAYICPSERRLVHYVRFLKGERRKQAAKEREKKSKQQAETTGS